MQNYMPGCKFQPLHLSGIFLCYHFFGVINFKEHFIGAANWFQSLGENSLYVCVVCFRCNATMWRDQSVKRGSALSCRLHLRHYVTRYDFRVKIIRNTHSGKEGESSHREASPIIHKINITVKYSSGLTPPSLHKLQLNQRHEFCDLKKDICSIFYKNEF